MPRRRSISAVERVEVARRVAADLGQRRDVRAATGQPQAIASTRRHAEALVEAREDERRRGAVEVDELVERDVPARLDARRSVSRSWPAPVSTSRSSGRSARTQRERLEEPVVVLVRPARSPGRGGTARAASLAGREALVVDAEVDRAHALRLEREALDQRLPRVLGDRDHDAAARPSSRRRARRYASSAREKNSGKSSCWRSRTVVTAGGVSTGGNITLSGKWIASRPSSRSRRRIRPGRAARERHRRDAARHRPRRAVLGDDGASAARPPASGAIVGTKTRYSSSPTRASAAELARVRLRAADDARARASAG